MSSEIFEQAGLQCDDALQGIYITPNIPSECVVMCLATSSFIFALKLWTITSKSIHHVRKACLISVTHLHEELTSQDVERGLMADEVPKWCFQKNPLSGGTG